MLFFLSNPVRFNSQDHGKEKEPGTSDQSLFRLQNKFSSDVLKFISDVLPDQV